MGEVQKITEIPLGILLEQVQGMHSSGRRLAQICCTRLAFDHEVNYSFDSGPDVAAVPQEPRFVTLRVHLPLENPELPSISCFYWSAFLYENEMHDLFGVNVKGMAVDFHGKLYTTAVPAPYAAKDPGNAS
jgi:ech hydrogenase subunit D